MSLKLLPDFYFDTFDKITVDFLKSHNIKFILTDVDNTLEPYENPKPGLAVWHWIDELKSNGIRIAIISNNNKERIDLFNEDIKLIAYSKAGKPRRKYIRLAMKQMGADQVNTLFVGDQIFTDVLGAHLASIPAVLVPPIKDKTDPFTRFKRLCEKPIMKKYITLNEKAGQN